jgi:putative endonuclease
MSTATRPHHLQIGNLAEELVAEWLVQQGGEILQHRWHCRWGELDLVARLPDRPPSSPALSVLAFVEVKARSRGNWDNTGLLAITPQKQSKLWKTAELFLSEHPDLATLPCRFDVALVQGIRTTTSSTHTSHRQQTPPTNARSNQAHRCSIQLHQPILRSGYQLTLQDYIINAFTSN